MHELRPGLWHWKAPHPQWEPTEPWDQNVSSYAIDDGERLLLFDPLSVPAEIELSPAEVKIAELAGDPIREVLSHAPGNGAAIGGVKVVSDGGWFAARPSGTEDLYKIYGESFKGADHLEQVFVQAREVVSQALG